MAMPPLQPDSRRILSNLLLKLRLPNSPYKRFFEITNEPQQLEELMYRCVRMDILALIDDGRLPSIKRRDSHISHTGRAIYLHVVEAPTATRLYVGQAKNLHKRMEEHMSFRYRREKPSLHYYALQRSQSDYFVTLSYVPDSNSCRSLGIQNSELFLDLLETWCCLMFRTLSKKHLEEFLPKDIQVPNTTYKNLNLKLPLQESGLDWNEIRDILLESPDSLYQDYYFENVLKYHHYKPELIQHRKCGLEICKELDRVTIPHSTPSRPTLPSPPSTTFKPTNRRLQQESSEQITPSTPSSTKLKATTNLSMDDMRPNSGPASVEASNVNRSEKERRKRALLEMMEETPIKLPGSRPAKRICTDGHELTEHPVKRRLDWENVAEPKEITTQAIRDVVSDLNDLSDEDWSLGCDLS